MRVITVLYAGCVEGTLVVNDDEVDEVLEKLKREARRRRAHCPW